MNKPPHSGIGRIYRAFFYSIDGCLAVWKTEQAFRQEIVMAIILLPLAFFVGQGPVEIALLVSSVMGVLVCELINSSIEAAVDRIGFENHILSKRAKDIGSAVVMMSLLSMAIVWCLLVIFPLWGSF